MLSVVNENLVRMRLLVRYLQGTKVTANFFTVITNRPSLISYLKMMDNPTKSIIFVNGFITERTNAGSKYTEAVFNAESISKIMESNVEHKTDTTDPKQMDMFA